MFVLIKLSSDGESITEYCQAETLEEIEEDLRELTRQAIEEYGMSELTEAQLRKGWTKSTVDLYMSLRNGKPTLKELEEATAGFTWGEDNSKVVHIIQVIDNKIKKIL